MTNLLSRIFGRNRKGSGATAKDRLRFVLQHDRINLPPERMEAMKREILAVIVKYLVVDKDRVEIDLEQRDRTHSKLVAEIPVAINTPPAPAKAAKNPAKAVDEGGSRRASNGANAESDESQDEAEDQDEPEQKAEPKAEKTESGEEKKDSQS